LRFQQQPFDHGQRRVRGGLCLCQNRARQGCTITGYASEAIHIEDWSTDITVTRNTITASGTSFNGPILVISGSYNIKIAHNTIDASANSNSVPCINVLAGGSGNTPGGRSVIAPSYVKIEHNHVVVGNNAGAFYLRSVLYSTVRNNTVRARAPSPDRAARWPMPVRSVTGSMAIPARTTSCRITFSSA
jgi:hypothetical protein